MDFSLSDHQLLIRDTVREFMQTEVRPHVKDWERTDHFPLEAIKKLAALGCCGMLTPEAYGGSALDTISYVLMLQEVAKVHVALSTALAVTNSAVQLPLQYFATEQQKSRYLKPLATGEILGAFALTEPAAGSDAAAIQTRAELRSSTSFTSSPSSTSYVLSGTKTWVTNGSHAGVFLIFAKTQPDLGGRGITTFLVEPTFPGFQIGRHEDKMGQRSSPSVEIILNNCEVPAANRLGEEGQGLKIALSALDGGRIGIAAQAVGLAQAALDESIKFARNRKAFGQPISEFQAIQFMLADMHTEIEAARLLLYVAASQKDRLSPVAPASGRHSKESAVPSPTRHSEPVAQAFRPEDFPSSTSPAPSFAPHSEPAAAGEESLFSSTGHGSRLTGHASSSAKLYASEMVNRVVYKAVQIHGSQGYSRESEVERRYRDP